MIEPGKCYKDEDGNMAKVNGKQTTHCVYERINYFESDGSPFSYVAKNFSSIESLEKLYPLPATLQEWQSALKEFGEKLIKQAEEM